MIDPKIIEDLTRRLSGLVPDGARVLQDDLEKSIRASLNSAFARLDLVTREELDVQQKVLARTREKVEALATRLGELEKRLETRGKGGKASTDSGKAPTSATTKKLPPAPAEKKLPKPE